MNKGMSAVGLLTVLLIVLKLTGHVAISWLWVFSPLWLPTVVILGAIVAGIIVIALIAIFCILCGKGLSGIGNNINKVIRWRHRRRK